MSRRRVCWRGQWGCSVKERWCHLQCRGRRQLPRARRAGLIHLQLGPWPRWMDFLLQSASANGANLNFYFLGSSELNVTAKCGDGCLKLLQAPGVLFLEHRAQRRNHARGWMDGWILHLA